MARRFIYHLHCHLKNLVPAGHFFGSSFVRFHNGIVFTGDMGDTTQPIFDPTSVSSLRNTWFWSPHTAIASTQIRTARAASTNCATSSYRRQSADGTVLIPSFAIGRAQEMLYLLRTGTGNRDSDFPVYIDSPMAVDAIEHLSRPHRGT